MYLGAVAVWKCFVDNSRKTLGGFLILAAATLLLHRLVRQQVTTVRAAAHNLACSSDLKTFCKGLFCFLHRNYGKAVQ